MANSDLAVPNHFESIFRNRSMPNNIKSVFHARVSFFLKYSPLSPSVAPATQAIKYRRAFLESLGAPKLFRRFNFGHDNSHCNL